MSPAARLPLLIFGMLALVVGVLAGLARLAVSQVALPEIATTLVGVHGALMIPAFLGTVISLERAVALSRRWPYLAPLCAGLSGLAVIIGLPPQLAQLLGIVAAATLSIGSLLILRQQPALYTATLALGAVTWLIGSLVWLISSFITFAVPWWMAFLVLTIAGERLELTRFLPTKPEVQRLFVIITGALLLGLTATFWQENEGLRLYAATLFALSVWLLRYDIARHTVKQTGLPRFIAICLLGGYGWLATGGVLGLLGGFASGAAGSPLRDAALHAIFLGFVFSMIFGHAPIIFPAVAKARIPYHPVFYLPLAVLHASLLVRVTADLSEASALNMTLRQLAAIGNGIALALFIMTMAISALRGYQQHSS